MSQNQGAQKQVFFAVHTPEYAEKIRILLENEGIETQIQSIGAEFNNLIQGVRISVKSTDLAQAIRVVENKDIFILSNPPMTESGRILVPVDFTAYSYQALVQAFRIAKILKYEIILFHTYLDPTTTAKIHLSEFYSYTAAAAKEIEQVKRVEDDAMERLEKRILSDIKNGLIPAVHFTRVLSEGVPEDAILEYAKTNNPDLIIMGTRDSVQKERDLIGSISAEVLDNCRDITMTIPATCADFNILNVKNILFFAQLNQRDIIALDNISKVFPGKELNITLMHIPSRSDKFINASKALSGLADYARRRFPIFRIERPKYNPEELANGLSDLHFDIIAIVNRKRNPISRLLNPGLAHKLLFHENYPMMVIPV